MESESEAGTPRLLAPAAAIEGYMSEHQILELQSEKKRERR